MVVGRYNYNIRSREQVVGVFFFNDVEVCPLLVELGGVVRVVK